MQRNLFLIAIIGFLSEVLVIPKLQAQNQGGFRDGRDARMQTNRTIKMDIGLVLLVNNQQVQKELNLTEEQKVKVAKAATESSNALAKRLSGLPTRSPLQSTPAIRVMEIVDLRREHENILLKKLHEILQPSQFQRINEIYIQSQGIMALFTPGVSKALALTDQQQKEMKALNSEFMGKSMNVPMQTWDVKSDDTQAKTGYGYGMKVSTPETLKAQKDLSKQLDDKLLAILTEDQRDQFEKMKGVKTDIKFPTTSMSSSMQSRNESPKSAEGK
jgi:hypothetical protein